MTIKERRKRPLGSGTRGLAAGGSAGEEALRLGHAVLALRCGVAPWVRKSEMGGKVVESGELRRF